WHPEQERDRNDVVGRSAIYPEDRLQIEQRVELPGIPNDSLSCGGAEQRNNNQLQILPMREGFFQRLGRRHPGAPDVLENSRLFHSQTNVERDRNKKNRDEEGNAPAPRCEGLSAHHVLHREDHCQREEQPKRCSDLNKAGVEASLSVRHVLGHVNRRSAILASERKALKNTNQQQNDGRRNPDRRISRQEADERRCASHYEQGDEKRVLASDQIAYPTEEECAERPHHESDRER